MRTRLCGILRYARIAILVFVFSAPVLSQDLELSRPARPWEFLSATGQRAGLFGNEAGDFEAWIYPLKLFRNFHVRFVTDGRRLPAETLVRTVSVCPESSTIVYSGDTFSVRETLFVPVSEPGALILFEVETSHPLEIEADLERDFQLEWPAALGGTYSFWEPNLKAFYFGEEQKKYVALIGSSTAAVGSQEYQTNYSASSESALRLGVTLNGKETKVIAMSASVSGRADAERAYKHLLADYPALMKESAQYYRDYLARTVAVNLPDSQLQQAYDWARVSLIQGFVTNPYLGTGLVAGYRTSGMTQRPGFAWYFGRDSFWSALALDAEGDFQTTRTALEFVAKYQRADGKIPHEIAQGANFVNWFTDYPYAYASADGTPLYIIATDDYVAESGDTAFAREKWESLEKAYHFLHSTYDAQGLPQNFGVGHGWVEGGPLLPIKTELYQSGLSTQALLSLSHLATAAGKVDVAKQLLEEFSRQRELVDRSFWSPESHTYAFALDGNNQQVVEPSVLATVLMWFDILDKHNAGRMLPQLAGPEHQTDWGMRIISSQSPKYDAGGYHFGSVWPLFTGWASVGEYRYHHDFPAYLNLRANALLALDGSLGHVTEVLSGDYYQGLSTSSPHQIWSAAMVVSPLLRGLFGIKTDAASRTLVFSPHVPAGWTSFALHRLRIGDTSLDLRYSRTADQITLEISSSGKAELEFSPAVALRAQAITAELNGRRVAFQPETNDSDQHVTLRTPLIQGNNVVRIRVRDDFGLSYASVLPPLGSRSQGFHILSESWSETRDVLTIEAAGVPRREYEITVWNPGQIASVEGADVHGDKLHIQFPPSAPERGANKKITIHFVPRSDRRP